MNTEALLFALLRIAVCGAAADDSIKTACTAEKLAAVEALASRHDLAHLVGQAVSKLELPEDAVLTRCKKRAMQALYRQVQLSYEYENICKTLKAAQISFIPLKGSVLRGYYPEPWMRTSCDIDILVEEATLDAATQVLKEKLSYQYQGKSGHDVSLFSAIGVHLELHYTTIEDEWMADAKKVLVRFWKEAQPVENETFHLHSSDEMFYFYHIAHMAKHMENGGCGIRPFLDIWILNHCVPHKREAREKLLAEGKLLVFAQAAEQLAEIWFSGAEQTPQSKCFARYILDGGVYGNMDNLVTMRQIREGSRVKYLLSRIFQNYDIIKYRYPVLQKHKWLLPFCQVARWFSLVFGGRLGDSLDEMKTNAALAPEEIQTTADMLKYLGL